jgi:16S rRNA (cytidine1402-2'-O)-methyltransferase
MSGTLYVVATPIGNLEDITLRALRVLREVAVIAAEDTRRSARLLGHHGITTRTISFHQHNTRARIPQLMSRLEAGDSVAIVTDAGTPGVSDPGLELVREALDRGIAVDPIPGATAPLTALIASGFEMVPFTVFGFVPNRAKPRTEWLTNVGRTPHSFSFFEAPHRIEATLREAGLLFGERPITVARELTKLHQEFLRGTASEVADRLSEPRGEFTVVVGPAVKHVDDSHIELSDAALASEFWQITESLGCSRRQAIAELAKKSGRSAREVYAAIERGKKCGV